MPNDPFEGISEEVILVKALENLFNKLTASGDCLENPQAVRNYLQLQLAANEHEVFSCVFLDTKHRVIAYEVLFYGTVDAATVYPRQIVKRSLAHNAGAVILAHNHPSGMAEPSQADRTLTKRIRDALALVDVRVLDHFVIGGDKNMEIASFAEKGWI